MSYSGKREEVPRFLTASFHVLSLEIIHGWSSLSKRFLINHNACLVQFIWTCLVWPQTEVRARVEFVPLDGHGTSLHLLLGAHVLPVGIDYPAHDEDVGAARVELAVVGESHTPLLRVKDAFGVLKEGTGDPGSAVWLDMAVDTWRSRYARV